MAAEARPAMVSSIIGSASLGGTAGSRSLIRPYVIFDCGACVADLGFYRGEASVGRLRSWLRRLRSVEAERDGLAEELEDAALSGGRRCRFFEAFPGEADGVSGECGQVGDQFVVSADGQLVRGHPEAPVVVGAVWLSQRVAVPLIREPHEKAQRRAREPARGPPWDDCAQGIWLTSPVTRSIPAAYHARSQCCLMKR